MKKYWMVHAESGGSPKKKHKSIIDADAEAMRLARANPDTKFALLEAIEYYICELPKPKAYKTEIPDNCEVLAEAAGMIPNIETDGDSPEPIVPVFIVHAVEGRGPETFIKIEPAVPGGPSWTYLRKGDGLMVHDEKGSYGYGVLETPTTSRIRIDFLGRIPKIGERLTLLGPT